MGPAGSDRLAAAFVAAFRRLDVTAANGPPDDVFVDLGETLFWLCAFAEANARGKAPLVLAMRWARDHIAHGLIVVAPVSWDDGSGLARMMPSRRGYDWKPRAAVPPLRQPSTRHATRDDAYDALAVGRNMISVVRDAFLAAGRKI